MPAVEYGLIIKNNEEKEIINKINEILEKHITNGKNNMYKYNRLTKRKPPANGVKSLNPNVKQYVYEYVYQYANKYWGFSLELYPNTDKNGDIKFAKEGVTWNLWLNTWNRHIKFKGRKMKICNSHNPDCRALVQDILDSISCDKILIKKYTDNEERL